MSDTTTEDHAAASDDHTARVDDRPGDSADGRSARVDSGFRTAARTGYRLLADVALITLWVLFCTLLFLETAWPRWAFYGVLLGGVAIYVSITAPWVDRPRGAE